MKNEDLDKLIQENKLEVPSPALDHMTRMREALSGAQRRRRQTMSVAFALAAILLAAIFTQTQAPEPVDDSLTAAEIILESNLEWFESDESDVDQSEQLDEIYGDWELLAVSIADG